MTSLERRNALKGNELAWYERMLEIREFERRTNELFAAGSIRGTTHLCVGQEALDIGLATSLNPDDVLAATYRSHGVALAFGLSSHAVMARSWASQPAVQVVLVGQCICVTAPSACFQHQQLLVAECQLQLAQR